MISSRVRSSSAPSGTPHRRSDDGGSPSTRDQVRRPGQAANRRAVRTSRHSTPPDSQRLPRRDCGPRCPPRPRARPDDQVASMVVRSTISSTTRSSSGVRLSGLFLGLLGHLDSSRLPRGPVSGHERPQRQAGLPCTEGPERLDPSPRRAPSPAHCRRLPANVVRSAAPGAPSVPLGSEVRVSTAPATPGRGPGGSSVSVTVPITMIFSSVRARGRRPPRRARRCAGRDRCTRRSSPRRPACSRALGRPRAHRRRS